MKKLTSSLILIAIILLSFASCGKITSYDGTLRGLLSDIYQNAPNDILLNEAKDLDLSSDYALESYLGLSSADGISQAIYSEPTFVGEAYSLVLIRVDDTAKIDSLKSSIEENINTQKWIITSADTLKVVSYGDIIMVLMLDSTLGESIAEDTVKAFERSVKLRSE